MKIKFSKKAIELEKSFNESISRKQSLSRWEKLTIVTCSAASCLIYFYYFTISPMKLDEIFFGTALALSCFFTAKFIVDQKTDTSWKTIFSLTLLVLPLFWYFASLIKVELGTHSLEIINVFLVLGLPIVYVLYNVYYHKIEYKRNPLKKHGHEIRDKKITIKKKEKNSDSIQRPLLHEQENDKTFEVLRAHLTMWGVPILSILLVIAGFYVERELMPKYVTVSAMGIATFMFLVTMVRPNTRTFWIVFLLSFTLVVLLVIFPPSFLPQSPLVQITIVSLIFLGVALIYWWKYGRVRGPSK